MSDDIVQPYRAALLLYIKQPPALQGKCFAVKDQNQTPRNIALRVAQATSIEPPFSVMDSVAMVGCAARARPPAGAVVWQTPDSDWLPPLKLLHHQPIAAQSHDTVSALRVNKSEAVGQGEKKIALQSFPARCRLNKLT